MTYPEIIGIGDLVIDLVTQIPSLPLVPEGHQKAHSIKPEAGGVANMLIAGARLCGETARMATVGVLGDDEWGHMVARILRDEDVSVEMVEHQGGTTVVIVLVDDAGEHVFVGAHGGCEPMRMRPGWEERAASAAAMYCSGYTLIDPCVKDIALECLETAHRAGIPCYFDPGPLMMHVDDVEGELVSLALSMTDVILLTEAEIMLVTDGGVRDILDSGPRMVVLKRGANGCAVYEKGRGPVEVPGFPVRQVDTTGCGDSFDAAFMLARLRGLSPEDCAVFSNAVGAVMAGKMGGGRNAPTAAEVRALLGESGISPERFGI